MGDTKRILIVEDDALTRKVYATVLTAQGYMVEQAEDGIAGLIKIQEGGFDLILLDAMLPKIDGFAILDKLKTTPVKQPNGPIVVTTNLVGEEIAKQALSAGAVACFRKTTFDPKSLLTMIHQYLH